MKSCTLIRPHVHTYKFKANNNDELIIIKKKIESLLNYFAPFCFKYQ